MVLEYHDHVCDECDSTIKDHCTCSESTWPDEEYCNVCKGKVTEREADLEDSETETETNSETESDSETKAETEADLFDDTARHIAEKLPDKE